MKIKKRDGNLVDLDLKQIRKQTEQAVEGLKNVSFEEIELNAKISFKDGMSTEDVQNLLIKSALDLVDVDKPDATYAAARLHMYDMYHRIKRTYFGSKIGGDVYKAISFTKYMNFNQNYLSWFNEKIVKYFDWEKINNAIVPDRDKLFNYLGIKMLEERYLIKQNIDNKNVVTELPQHMFMSLAIFAAQNQRNPTEKAIEWYNIFSKLEALPGTPTLKNGRTINGNCFSCAVGSMPDDLEGIYDAHKTIAVGSKYGSGWGYDVSKLRANGGTIQDIKGAAKGPIPFLQLTNATSNAVDQLG